MKLPTYTLANKYLTHIDELKLFKDHVLHSFVEDITHYGKTNIHTDHEIEKICDKMKRRINESITEASDELQKKFDKL